MIGLHQGGPLGGEVDGHSPIGARHRLIGVRVRVRARVRVRVEGMTGILY